MSRPVTRVAWTLYEADIPLVSTEVIASELFKKSHALLIQMLGRVPTMGDLIGLHLSRFSMRANNSDGGRGYVVPLPALYLMAYELGWLPEQTVECSWVTTVALNDQAFATFDEAARDFIQRMNALLTQGTSYQVVATACWVAPLIPMTETSFVEIPKSSILVTFFDFKDILREEGWIDNHGVWNGRPAPA